MLILTNITLFASQLSKKLFTATLLLLSFFIYSNSENSYYEDSILIKTHFNNATINRGLSDSLTHAAFILYQKNTKLKDSYNFYFARHKIQTGAFDDAKEIILEQINSNNKIALSKYYNLLASIYAYKNEQDLSVEQFKLALEHSYLEKNHYQSAMINFNLANIFLSRMDYETAHKYSKEAYNILTEYNISQNLALCNALLAITSVKAEINIDSAYLYAEKSLKLSEGDDIKNSVLSHYAMGEVLNAKSQYDNAVKHLLKSLTIAQESGRVPYLISIKAAILFGYIQTNDYENAIKFGEKALSIANQIGNDEIKTNLYKNLSAAYAGTGEMSKAYDYMLKSMEYFSKKLNVENEKTIKELVLKFETEKKEKLLLEKDNKLKARGIYILILFIILALSLLTIIFLKIIEKQKNKIKEEEKEIELLLATASGEERERERLASEIHDGVASQLVALKLICETSESKSEELSKISNIISKTHNDVRLIAQSIMPINFNHIPFDIAIKDFCNQLSGKKTLIYFYSNKEKILLNKNIAHNLYRATQELIQNSIKHANPTEIHVHLLYKNDILHINGEDNGDGYDEKNINDINALQFIKYRLDLINAKLESSSDIGKGSLFTISLDIAKKYKNH